MKVEFEHRVAKHRTVHPTLVAASHFVPVIARHFELCTHWKFYLRESDEIVKARFAGCFLAEEPPHFLQSSRRLEPWEERVGLPRSAFAQCLVPSKEGVRVHGRCKGCRAHLPPL